MGIEVKGVSKNFGDFKALDNVDLEIKTGELVALLGPSGSGKTTLLRMIAGLELIDEGSILFDGEDNTDKSTKDRNVGFVFQHYALFKQMTVFENVAFGLNVKPSKTRPSKEQIKAKVTELLTLVKMENFADRYPAQLSGGQRQRIALARALAVEPKVLLLDEPFGALDAKVRKELRRWLRRLHDEFNITSIFVTHDQEEALDVADRIVVLNKGKIEQIGTPEEVYENPANPFVYNFLGNVNLFHGRLEDGRIQIGDFELNSENHKGKNADEAISYVRPHDITIVKAEDENNTNFKGIKSQVLFIRSIGPIVNIELIRLDNKQLIEVELNKEVFQGLNIKEGDQVLVAPKDVKIFIEGDYVI